MPVRGYIRSLERCAEGIKRKLNKMVYDDVILYVSAAIRGDLLYGSHIEASTPRPGHTLGI